MKLKNCLKICGCIGTASVVIPTTVVLTRKNVKPTEKQLSEHRKKQICQHKKDFPNSRRYDWFKCDWEQEPKKVVPASPQIPSNEKEIIELKEKIRRLEIRNKDLEKQYSDKVYALKTLREGHETIMEVYETENNRYVVGLHEQIDQKDKELKGSKNLLDSYDREVQRLKAIIDKKDKDLKGATTEINKANLWAQEMAKSYAGLVIELLYLRDMLNECEGKKEKAPKVHTVSNKISGTTGPLRGQGGETKGDIAQAGWVDPIGAPITHVVKKNEDCDTYHAEGKKFLNPKSPSYNEDISRINWYIRNHCKGHIWLNKEHLQYSDFHK